MVVEWSPRTLHQRNIPKGLVYDYIVFPKYVLSHTYVELAALDIWKVPRKPLHRHLKHSLKKYKKQERSLAPKITIPIRVFVDDWTHEIIFAAFISDPNS